MNGTTFVTLLASTGALITAIVAALISWRKQKAEERKTIRNGVIHEWQEITDRLQSQIDEHAKRIAAQGEKIEQQTVQIVELIKENAALRTQIAARETERVELRTDLRKVEKQVVELKQPDNPEGKQ